MRWQNGVVVGARLDQKPAFTVTKHLDVRPDDETAILQTANVLKAADGLEHERFGPVRRVR